MLNERTKTSRFRPVTGALLFLILLIGAGIRFIEFSNPPLDFHPARQLHSALIARGFYLSDGGDLPGRDLRYREEARMRGDGELWIEPPIMEYVSAKLYALIGDADLRVPRALAISFWLLGAIGLIWLTGGWLSESGVLAAVGVYLLLPYGVYISRSFQPEALMTFMAILSLGALMRWSERNSWGLALLSGLFIGLAIFVKQVMIFPLGLALACAMLGTAGSVRKAIASPQRWGMGLLAILPITLYNVWGLWIDGFLGQQYQGRFNFGAWFTAGFYIRWLRETDAVFGILLAAAALIGISLLRGTRRAIWLGYFAGFVLYGFALPHHIGTHDYYQTPLFPLVAVGIGVLADRVARSFRHDSSDRLGSVLLAASLTIVCGWWVLTAGLTLRRVDYRTFPERLERMAQQYDPYPNQINVVGLMDDYGAGMMYWALRTPVIWDRSVETLSAEEADQVLRETFNNRQYLIVTDFPRFYQQPRLQEWLKAHGELVERDSEGCVYRIHNGDNPPEEKK